MTTEKKKNENVLKPLAIGELLKQVDNEPLYNFYIPSYQRGYRWDKDEINDLLEDLFEFIYQDAQQKYCLQPIVVKEMSDGKFEVLDGQQRLTTIFIILKSLKKYLPKLQSFTLSYQTRPNSEFFLQNLREQNQVELNNPDYFFIDNAFKLITEWIDEKSESHLDLYSVLYTALIQKIEFIWYEIVEDTDAIEVFTRINIGKIPLTNAELVKALFLSKNNLLAGSQEININYLSLKQNKIALEWNELQNKLQDNNFWNFIYNGKKKYETRIDYILELICNSMSENKYASFREFYGIIKKEKLDAVVISSLEAKNTSLIEHKWEEIKFVVQIIEEWYKDHYYYHFIGFLINQKWSIKTLVIQYLKLDRDKFSEYLKVEINSILKQTNIIDLRYGPDSVLIKKILILYNVISTFNIKDENVRFPFHLHSENQWSLEHIYAQNSDALKADDYELWLKENCETLKNDTNPEAVTLSLQMQQLIQNVSDLKSDSTIFNDVFSAVTSYYLKNIESINMDIIQEETNIKMTDSEQSGLLDEHAITNLTLLDINSNSALNNSLFDVKRMKIIERDKQGYFIPLETKRIFFKYHTNFPRHISYWTREDKVAYLADIRRVLKDYIN
ncbi:DUF262 domain-containing protein [Flavobacterium branchiophilum]|uniref:GmrSD restriction endonucleases N-terminal domain-containing protein n=1 Tax=Flavobacterium branchiophilum TaxID=55197 RepID=A0A2H3K9E5_9FLAO|nr:DUF262 domain-containing protein [Flavobacterium branchiophilum]PDS22715.1 hypothetical protein B0A77_12390 [Flavobacterium branchiophilum]